MRALRVIFLTSLLFFLAGAAFAEPAPDKIDIIEALADHRPAPRRYA